MAGKINFSKQQKRIIAISVVILVLFTDQIIKVLVKTGMYLHESIPLLGDWSFLYFTENEGMAFGWDFIGTMFLSIFRIVAVIGLIYFLHIIIKRGASLGFVVCCALVLAGAAGNIFDNVLYGLIFSESTEYEIARFVPFGEGYGHLLSGRVVDMFYFPIIDTVLPEWVPLKGGERFIFFSPIFNFADSAITCGGFAIVLFFRHSFARYATSYNEDNHPNTSEP